MTSTNIRGLVLAIVAMAVSLVSVPNGASAEARPQTAGDVFLLAVSVCPPYRKDIPVEVCENGVKAVVDDFGAAFGIEKANIISLVGERSTGRNFLRTLSDLRGRLKAEDRLILYLNGHGDAFSMWARYYDQGGAVADINRRFARPDEDLIVFWTREEPTVPVLALAQKDWLTVKEVVDAIERLPAKVALILESCSSGQVFGAFHRQVKRSEHIDYIIASSGSEQLSNISPGQTMPLFTQQLTAALDMPMVRNFGDAVALARITTVQMAASVCAMQTVPKGVFAKMFPGLTVPLATDHEGNVSLPPWSCAQVPSVADYSGEMTNMPLYGSQASVGMLAQR